MTDVVEVEGDNAVLLDAVTAEAALVDAVGAEVALVDASAGGVDTVLVGTAVGTLVDASAGGVDTVLVDTAVGTDTAGTGVALGKSSAGARGGA